MILASGHGPTGVCQKHADQGRDPIKDGIG